MFTRPYLALLLWVLLLNYGFSQNIDSAKKVLSASKDDLISIKTLAFLSDAAGDSIFTAELKKLCKKNTASNNSILAYEAKKGLALAINNEGLDFYSKYNIEQAGRLLYEALNMRLKIKDAPGISESYYNLGYFFENRNDDSSFYHYTKSYNLRLKNGDNIGVGKSLHKMANCQYGKGNYHIALKYYYSSLKVQEKTGNLKGYSLTLRNIALIQLQQNDTVSAMKNLFKAKDIAEKIKHNVVIYHTTSDLGTIYMERKDSTKALQYYRKALTFTTDNLRGKGLSYLDIAKIYLEYNMFETAIVYLKDALNIFETVGDMEMISATSRFIGFYEMSNKNFPKANTWFVNSLTIAEKYGITSEKMLVTSDLYKLYNQQSKYKEALTMFEKHIALKEQLYNERLRKDAISKQYEYEYGKRESEIKATAAADKKRIEEVAKKDKEKQQLTIYFITIGLLLVIIFAVFIFNRFKVTQKQKLIIEQKEKETQEKNLIISRQKDLVEEKQKEILDSIRYAKRIQNSLMPTEKYISKIMKGDKNV